jgi:hypothetical protein
MKAICKSICSVGLSALVSIATGLTSHGAESGRAFYVDASAGADERDGLSAGSAWQSLRKVNKTELKPGDRVLFKRGGMWRGSLIPQSGDDGAPVTYGAYGEGPKPQLLGSLAMNRPEDWRNEGGNIWTSFSDPVTQDVPADLKAQQWSVHSEGGAKIAKTIEGGAIRIRCEASGTAGHQIQLYLQGLPVVEGTNFVFEFRARSSMPFTLSRIGLSKATAPWSSYNSSKTPEFSIGTNWSGFSVRFKATQTTNDGRITFHLGGALPAGAQFEFEPVAWKQLTYRGHESIALDVGNIIFDGGPKCGVKKWSAADLKQPGDYWYSAAEGAVKLFSEANPAALHTNIEFALTRHIIEESGRHHVTYENLDLRYGAAHGIGGSSTHHITARNLDISYIGGGHQHTRPDGRPVRYGNGIEFWSAAHDNLVEGCRIWEIYDAALTNQGDDNNEERDIVYRDNVIWNSEYSFEYWNGKHPDNDKTREQKSKTRDILFERNTCFAAGRGWGHTQRPDINGRHLMFYHNAAATQGVIVRENIFCDSTDSCLRMQNDWTAGLVMDRNCWFQPQGELIWFLKAHFTADQFDEYRKQSGLDAHSIVADPQFRDVRALDFRLTPASPAAALAKDGGPVGSRKRLND